MKLQHKVHSLDKDANGLFPSQSKALSELESWYNSNSLEATLKGYAGTGKTFLLKKFVELIASKKSFAITAPTHKALRVMENHLGVKGLTLQSLHGLKPNTNLETFDINNPNFDTIGRAKIEYYSLVIIDESSMINKSLFLLNRQRAKEHNVKILYVGDPLQLPPVREAESEVFHSVDKIIELTQIIRQGKDNPLLDVFELLRDDIINGTSNALRHISKHPKAIRNDVGYKMMSLDEYRYIMMQYFKNDKFYQNVSYVRSTAYTNLAVGSWNNSIRESIFETDNDQLILDDLLTSYSTIVDEMNSPIIINSEDYYIKDIRPYRNEFGLDVICVILTSIYNKTDTQMLQILDHRNPANLHHFKNLLVTLRNNAKKDKKKWFNYFKFKNQILSMVDVQIDGLKATRDLDYGYSLTTHKLQGSTFENIFIDGLDICTPLNQWGKRMNTDINLRNRLLYVALSRASNIAYIRF